MKLYNRIKHIFSRVYPCVYCANSATHWIQTTVYNMFLVWLKIAITSNTLYTEEI